MEFGKNIEFPGEDRDAVFVSLTDGKFSDRLESTQSAQDLYTGEVAAWANRRTYNFGDFIEPKQIYLEWVNGHPHRVVWVDHMGINRDTNSPYHLHHVVCDCAYYENTNFPEEDELADCGVMQNALVERTELVARQHRVREMIDSYGAIPAADYSKNNELNDILVKSIESILVFDRAHPEEWVGNVVSGEHDVTLLSLIIKQPQETVRLCADILAFQGKVEISGDTLRLAA
jgi:hypothetical protein